LNILFEINHPGHIHLFRNLASELRGKKISYIFLIKSDPVIERLAQYYDLPFIKMGVKGSGLVQKYLFQIKFLFKSVYLAKKYKIDLALGVSMNLPLVSKFTRMKAIGFDDDDMAVTPAFAKYANKASVILTPSALKHEQRGSNHITYEGYHELAYLHPKRFEPFTEVFELPGIFSNTDYFIVRFNSFKAHHDVSQHGMTFEQKKELVKKLGERGKVFISTETDLDTEFSQYKVPNKPEMMHSILAHSKMYVGESQTMTSEAAILGTPALKCNTFAGRLSIPKELEEKYGLCFSYLPEDFEKMLAKIDELLAMPDLKAEWQRRRQKLLSEKIDVTAFMLWFVENYPESVAIMKSNPDYQNRFR
jgi:uncharacterized protein